MFDILNAIQKHKLFAKQEGLLKYHTQAMKLLDCFSLNNDIYKQLVTAFISNLKHLNNGTINSSKNNMPQIHPFLYDFKYIYIQEQR